MRRWEVKNLYGFLNVLFQVSNLCNKIGHRRGRPWEILYECTLHDFYDVAFAWSRNALLDIGGKAVVEMMKGRWNFFLYL